MAVNQVQFEAGLSMVQFIRWYGMEAKCHRALYQALAAGLPLPEATPSQLAVSPRGAVYFSTALVATRS